MSKPQELDIMVVNEVQWMKHFCLSRCINLCLQSLIASCQTLAFVTMIRY